MATPADRLIDQVPLIVTVGVVGAIASQVAKMSKSQRKRLINKQPYYCKKCKRRHNYGTVIYKEHMTYGK